MNTDNIVDNIKSLHRKEKAAIITALKWINSHKQQNSSAGIARIASTAAILCFDLNDPILNIFDQKEDQYLTSILNGLNRYQKIWVIIEMHVTATWDGKVDLHSVWTAMEIAKGMGFSSEEYTAAVNFTSDFFAESQIEEVSRHKAIIEDNNWELFAELFSYTHHIRSYIRWFIEDGICIKTFVSNYAELTGNVLLHTGEVLDSPNIHYIKLCVPEEFDNFFTAAYPDIVRWYLLTGEERLGSFIEMKKEVLFSSDRTLNYKGLFYIRQQYWVSDEFCDFECSQICQCPNAAKLVSHLKLRAKALDELESKLRPRLDVHDHIAEKRLRDHIRSVSKIYEIIGLELYEIGGKPLMQEALNQVPAQKGAHSVINAAWNDIGDWKI